MTDPQSTNLHTTAGESSVAAATTAGFQEINSAAMTTDAAGPGAPTGAETPDSSAGLENQCPVCTPCDIDTSTSSLAASGLSTGVLSTTQSPGVSNETPHIPYAYDPNFRRFRNIQFETSEAKGSAGIGGVFISACIVFFGVIFLLDVDNLIRGFAFGYRNCRSLGRARRGGCNSCGTGSSIRLH